jgi:Protein of unknown function (DUF3300)
MRLKSCLRVVVVSIALVTLQVSGLLLSAQAPTPQQLDQLLAPVALYPDSLLAQITTASTNPQEILDVSNWLQRNQGLQAAALTDAAEKQGFDPAFIALVNFPDVLNMMAENVDDFAAIGQAFSADQGAVSASIQRLRAQAYAAGNLRSNPQQQVVVQQAAQPIYVIQPANPQVVYVPIYNPTVVYVRPPANVVVVSYGPPISIGILVVSTRPWGWMGWGWNWTSRRCYYNHTVWVGWRNPYRPPYVWYRPRPVHYSRLPGYGGNWRYRPPNYRPPVPVRLPANRPPWGPNHRPGYNPPPSNRPGAGRPPVPQPKPQPKPQPRPQPKPGTPSQPIARPAPSKQPGATRPTGGPPAQSKPVQPRPGTPSQPNTRPAPQKQPGATRLPGNPPAQRKPDQPSANRSQAIKLSPQPKAETAESISL